MTLNIIIKRDMPNINYPENNTLLNNVVLKNINAYRDENGAQQDMNISATGNLIMGCESDKTIEMQGDMLMNSNLILNGTTYMQDANIFRVFNDDYTISYGFHINDYGNLELYKHDSRVDKSTVITSFGGGEIVATAPSASETATSKIDNILNKNSSNSINIFGKSLARRQN
jgi:hypothetical protein